MKCLARSFSLTTGDRTISSCCAPAHRKKKRKLYVTVREQEDLLATRCLSVAWSSRSKDGLRKGRKEGRKKKNKKGDVSPFFQHAEDVVAMHGITGLGR